MNERFDRFADAVAEFVAHAGFFVFCVLLVVTWGPSILVLKNVDTWQLVINTVTTIITFLLVALLHNTQHRFEQATNERLHDLEEAVGSGDPVQDKGQRPDLT
jgi:low affinity Fe/Cu permease